MSLTSISDTSMPFSSDLIPDAVARYRRERDRYVKLADRIAEICREDICEQNAIRAQVTFRVKTPKSFEGKLKRFSTRPDKTYADLDEIFAGIGDLAGVRIATYRIEDCEEVVAHLKKAFTGPNGAIEIDSKDKNEQDKENYYRAIHVQVALPAEQQVGIYDNVGDISCEIQVCTMIAHVWNEIEHDIGYKTDLGAPSEDEKYHLSQLGKLVRQGDLMVSALIEAHARHANAEKAGSPADVLKDKFVDQYDFVARMRDFPGYIIERFAENSGQLFELFLDLGLSSPAAIHDVIKPIDATALRESLGSLETQLWLDGEARLLPDPETSDLLLVALLSRRLGLVLETLKGRAGRGRGRPTRLHSIALRFQKWAAETNQKV